MSYFGGSYTTEFDKTVLAYTEGFELIDESELKNYLTADNKYIYGLNDKDIDAVATYVAGGFKGTAPAAFATCASCHGDDGKGMEAVAPNIRAYDDSLVMAV